jgi:hypothetical protein
MKRVIRQGLWAAVTLILLAALLIFVSSWIYQNTYLWGRDQSNQEEIAKAYVAFYRNKTNFPGSLADLVEAGFLPEKADWYKEPPGLFGHPTDFKESCYVVMPPKSNNVENLHMIGRRTWYSGEEQIDFTSFQNDVVRGAIEQLQRKR